MLQLVAALSARDQRLGLGDATEVEQVAWNLTRAAADSTSGRDISVYGKVLVPLQEFVWAASASG